MKRTMLCLIAIAGMLFLASSGTNAATYNVYGKTANQPASKVVQNMLQAVAGDVVVPPVVDSQITEADSTRMIIGGTLGHEIVLSEIVLSEGDVIYIEGMVHVQTLRNTAENAVVLLSSNKESALVVTGTADLQSRNGLIQILGAGREYITWGLYLFAETVAKLRNVVIADNFTGLGVTNGRIGERSGAQLSADQLFVLNNSYQFENSPGSYPPISGHGAQIVLTNSVIWDSEPPDQRRLREAIKLYLPVEFDATNSVFSDNVNIGTQFSLAELGSMPKQSRIVFTDCVFSDWFDRQLRRADFSDNSLSDDIFKFIAVQETRPILGGTHIVKTFPDVPPILFADFTGSGEVNAEDVALLSQAFGSLRDSVVFGDLYDLNHDGAVNTPDLMELAYAFAGIVPSEPTTVLAASPKMPEFLSTIVQYPAVVAAAKVDPDFGPIIQNYLDIQTAVAEVYGEVPGTFALEQNYPNPFNPETTIQFSLSENADVALAVYNIAGQEVARLVDEMLQAGSYNVQWDGRMESGQLASSGMYFYRLTADEYTEMRRMTLLR